MSTKHQDSPGWPSLTHDEELLVADFNEAHRRLNEGLIRLEQTFEPPKRTPERWKARMDEVRSFMSECGDPQRAFKTIHVTGTSGKGSVSTMIARALHLAGYRVGLHTSPYLQVPTEKNWVDGALMSARELADLVEWVWPVAIPRKKPETPASIHGMASVAICFELFRRHQVDVAVIEAGCGGRFDLTNVIQPMATAITSVGMDHALALGPEVTDIAWHKAGVMKPGVPAVTGATGEPLEVIRREARELGVELKEIPPIDGPFWEINASIARATLESVGEQLPVAPELIDRAMTEGRLPARFELAPEPGRRVIIDGAHNADKMAALVRALEPGCVFVMGCLHTKDPSALVKAVKPVADLVVATEPTPYAKPPTPASQVAQTCRDHGIDAVAVPRPMDAIERALELARPDQTIVISGSLYLVGELRGRWFPWERVLLQQTSWPKRPD